MQGNGKVLTWNGERVRDLMRIARDAPGHNLSYAELHAGKERPEPALWFVKDEGAYLMANTRYEDGSSPINSGEIEYAHGLGPDVSYERVRTVCGGDDFCEVLYVDDLQETLEACEFRNDRNLSFVILIRDEDIVMGWFLDKGEKGRNGTTG